MPQDFTPAELKSWITKLHDSRTSAEELKNIAMELAHVDHPEAVQALEQFRESTRAKEVEWIEQAIDECTYGVLSPSNEREQKDYIRVELWQDEKRRWVKSEGRKAPVTLPSSPFAHATAASTIKSSWRRTTS